MKSSEVWWRRTGQAGLGSRLDAHPVLFGCLFVLHGFADLQPMARVWDLFFYLAVVSAAIFLLQLVLALLVRQPRKPAILASLCVVFFCFLGELRLQLTVGTHGATWDWLTRLRVLMPVAGTVFLVLCFWLLRTPRTLETIRRYLNAVSTILVAVTLTGILWRSQLPPIRPAELADVPMPVGAHPPDIYYILTDAYTSPESLKAFWNYDDSPLVNSLTGLGFHVIRNAHANATSTPICLATYLNMNYMPALSDRILTSGAAYYSKIISQAEAPSRLKASGYDVRSLSIFDVAGSPRLYYFPGVVRANLGSFLFSRLAVIILLNHRVLAGFGAVNLKVFSLLPQIAAERSDRPKFIYAHVMMPHWPYLFDNQGRRVQRGMRPDESRPEDYLSQLIYENTLITNAVAGILQNSKAPPIIIVQGDHGYRYLEGPHKYEEGPTILNALYLPGSEADWLYPGITPVNTFRLIFNHYFGQHYKYLPDIVPAPGSPAATLQDDK